MGTVRNVCTRSVRYAIRRDIASIMAIENASFDYPLSESDFAGYFKQIDVIGGSCEVGDRLAGFVFYELHKKKMVILDLAVDKWFRRRGIGSTLISWMVNRLNPEHRNTIEIEIGERNTDAHLFFRSAGFQAVEVIKGRASGVQDSYLFRYRI